MGACAGEGLMNSHASSLNSPTRLICEDFWGEGTPSNYLLRVTEL